MQKWRNDYDVAMEETNAAFSSWDSGVPADVNTAGEELKRTLDQVTRDGTKHLKVFDDMVLEEMTKQHQNGQLDLKKQLTEACGPATTLGTQFGKASE